MSSVRVLLVVAAFLLVAAPRAEALPACGYWGVDCDAWWWTDTMGDVAVSRTQIEPGSLITVTATVGTMAPYWSRTEQGYIASGVGSVTVHGIGTVVSFTPPAGSDLTAAANGSDVTWTGVELNPPGQGVPTSTWGRGKQFTVTLRVPRNAPGGASFVSADYGGRRGFIGWGAQARRYVEVKQLPDVTIGGRLLKVVCTPVCETRPAAGEPVSVAGTSDVDDAIDRSAQSGEDGSWSVQVPRGRYTVTPPAGMEPASRSVTVTGDVGGLDFTRPAPPMPLPPPPPPPPPVEDDRREDQRGRPCVELCLPRPEVRAATWKAASARRGAKAGAAGRAAAVRVVVTGQPGIRYGLHLVEGTTCRRQVLCGTLRALGSMPVTVWRGGRVTVVRDVGVVPGRHVSAYITDGRDRSPYAACRAVGDRKPAAKRKRKAR